MQRILTLITLIFSSIAISQNDALAKEFFEKGNFEKAVIAYEELYKSNKTNYNIYNNLIKSYQELKAFDKAEKIINEVNSLTKQPNLWVELGYNYHLQKNTQKAEENYKKAIEYIDLNPHYAGSIAYTFETKNLLEKALEVYNLGYQKNNNLNFDIQKARIYGQLGDIEKMIDSYLDYCFAHKNYTPSVQSQFQRFIIEDNSDSFSNLLRKILLTRAQKTQDLYWNEFLSWFFIQQKQYDRAFAQEKSVYLRNPESFSNIINLANLAVDNENPVLAKEIFQFILENTNDQEIQILVHTNLMEIKLNDVSEKEYKAIEKDFQALYTEFGKDTKTISLQLLEANFIGFKLGKPKEAQEILKKILGWRLNIFEEAEIKLQLADLYLYEEKFNQALIYYSQIESSLNNHKIGHEANLMIAKTSYYKGDFEWSLKQLKTLKTSFSQLIANDALDLYLLITDSSKNDSTYTALKKFAKADFLVYKNKKQEALNAFINISQEHKGEDIEAVTILRIGDLFTKEKQYEKALQYYQTIINHFPESIYLDEAYYYSAEIYNKNLSNPEKAKEYYEKIIFNHQDSIYFVDSRKEYRSLRGDTL